MEISKSELDIWKNSRVTKALKERLKLDMQEIMFSWGQGAYTTESTEGTIQLNSTALGKFQSLDDVVAAIEVGDFVEVFED